MHNLSFINSLHDKRTPGFEHEILNSKEETDVYICSQGTNRAYDDIFVLQN